MTKTHLRVLHPTDFSQASARAFMHALKIAVETGGDLFLLHMESAHSDDSGWEDFPHVRQTLQAWGLLAPGARRSDVQAQVGIQVAKFDIVDNDLVDGVAAFSERYGGDLIVLSTAARSGVSRWLYGSKAAAILREVRLPTLFVPAEARGFVNEADGTAQLRKVVAPVDHNPRPLAAIRKLAHIMSPLGLTSSNLKLVHVGEDPPVIQGSPGSHPAPVTLMEGPVVDAILEEAADADLIALATEGRHGVLDALRGSTTEQIVRRAPCPVLALPSR